MIKLKGIAKIPDDGEFSVAHGLRYLLEKNGFNAWGGQEAIYKASFSIKRGKRRKLKKYKVRYYNKYQCECCGPYWVAEIV